MQLRKRKTIDVDAPDPMKVLRVGARLTDTFRVRRTVQVHASSGKRAVSRVPKNDSTIVSVAVAPAARQGQTAAAAAVPSAKASAEQPCAGAAAVPSATKRRKRASKKAVKGAAAEGVEEAVRDALAPPLPPLNAERIAIGVAHLASVNTRLAQLIAENGQPEQLVPSNGSTFAALARSIVSQQLATGAARVIHSRFLTACKCEAEASPEAVLAAPLPDLRAAGLSGQKTGYITDLAAHYADGRLSCAALADMTEEEAIEKLTAVKGIGVWTAHMYLIFSAGRPDVLPVGDLGVRKGIQICFGLKDLPDASKMEALTASWRPWRSIGSWYMWRLTETEGKRTPKKAAKKPAETP